MARDARETFCMDKRNECLSVSEYDCIMKQTRFWHVQRGADIDGLDRESAFVLNDEDRYNGTTGPREEWIRRTVYDHRLWNREIDPFSADGYNEEAERARLRPI